MSFFKYLVITIAFSLSMLCIADNKLNFLPPKKNHCLNHDFLKQLIEKFSIKIFIETGTYLGDSTAVAAQLFEKVHTIELSENLYK